MMPVFCVKHGNGPTESRPLPNIPKCSKLVAVNDIWLEALQCAVRFLNGRGDAARRLGKIHNSSADPFGLHGERSGPLDTNNGNNMAAIRLSASQVQNDTL